MSVCLTMRRTLATLLLLLGLTGCSGLRLIDSEVLAQAAPGADTMLRAGARYRYERLPSQQNDPGLQQTLERAADLALGKVGLRAAGQDQQADLGVMLSVQSAAWVQDDEGNLFPVGQLVPRMRIGIGLGTGGSALALSMPITYLYRHQLVLLMRDLRSGQIAYETRAWHEGPWPDRDMLLQVMLDAALQGFPNPPSGRRLVRTEVPR